MRYLILFLACWIAHVANAQHQIDFEIPDCPVVSGVHGMSGDFQLSVFPNPSSGLFQVSLESDENREKIDAECYDVLGQRILALSFDQTDDIRLDLSHFGIGVYHLVLTSGTRRSTRKLIVN